MWVVLLIASVPLLLLAAGLLYQALGAWRDRRRFAQLGRLVEIAPGQRLYAEEAGPTGADGPAVIFESGIAATSQNWHRLQAEVSGFARTLSYDRGGLGFSSASPSARTPANIVRELRALLQQAGIAPPYVLVGHSFGGLVMRRFAAEHPEEVVGVLLLDAMRPEDWPPVNETQAGHVARGIQLTGLAVPIARSGLARLAIMSLMCRSGRVSGVLSRAAGKGGLHVVERVTCEVGKMPPEVWPVVAAHWSSPRFYRGMREHLRAIPETVTEMHHGTPIEEKIPVLLLTAATDEPLPEEGLRRIGRNARQVVVEGSGHWVHLDQHEVVLAAIREMVDGAEPEERMEASELMVSG